MTLIIILLQVFFIGHMTLYGVVEKSLSQMNIIEINQIMEKANYQLKIVEIGNTIDSLCLVLNGSILVASEKTVLYHKNAGLKQLSNKNTINNQINDSTLFDLASISKQFTAASILKLVNENQLKLSDSITQFISEFPYHEICIRHLLTHTSGLPEYFDMESSFNNAIPLTNEMLINFLIAQKPKLLFTPGSKFKYINTNYALLASIIEKVSGISFIEYVKTNMFIPAAMRNSCFFTELSFPSNTNHCKGYLGNGKQEPDYFMNSVLGDKCLYSTTLDMHKWAISYFMDYKIIPQEWVEKASSPQNTIKEKLPQDLYGYGLRIEENPYFGKLVYHGGLWKGFNNIMMFRPSDRFFIIILSNYRNKAISEKTNLLLEIWDGA
jgi:CubicO group peptidase (beta-lactamase class C family)